MLESDTRANFRAAETMADILSSSTGNLVTAVDRFEDLFMFTLNKR